MYNRLENFIQSLIERVLELIEDKISDKIEQLWKKYQKKKQIKNGELDNDNDSVDKKNKKKLNEEEEEDIKITKKSNQMNKEEDINLPELNDKAIEKSKKNKKNLQEIIKEKSNLLINEKNTRLFFKKAKQFCIKFGTKETINNILIPKLINILSDFFKDKLKTKLLPELLSRFDDNFERFGIHIIFLQKKYNIKGFIDKLLDRIRKAFDIIVDIQLSIIPILRDFQNKIKNGEKVHVIIMNFSNELITEGENKFINPFKDFINRIFGEKEGKKRYNFFENIIKEAYAEIKEIGIEKYEELKEIAFDKYEEYKNIYLDNKKKIK